MTPLHRQQPSATCQQGPRKPHQVGQRAHCASNDRVVALLRLVQLRTGLYYIDVREPERVANRLEKATLLAGRLDQRKAAFRLDDRERDAGKAGTAADI